MARNIAPQDISWFLDLHKRERLNLDPPYQRKSVWTPRERRFFLDTVFNGFPSPPVFLHKTISDEGVTTYHVVDGKQRLETIINFEDNKIALSEDMQDERLNGKRWKGITDVSVKKNFWNYPMSVEMLDVVDSASVIEIFDRYNRTSKNLERQELRHARYDGWFTRTAEAEARKPEWRDFKIVTAATARRMRDVQFISELMIVQINNSLSGFSQDMLDYVYATYDSPSETEPDFSEEDFIENFQKVKNWIVELQNIDNVVSTYAKSATHFYSLWGVISLNYETLPGVRDFSDRYKDFMSTAMSLMKTKDADESAKLSEEHPLPFSYAQNSRGASTEPPQRLARHEALQQGVLGLGAVDN